MKFAVATAVLMVVPALAVAASGKVIEPDSQYGASCGYHRIVETDRGDYALLRVLSGTVSSGDTLQGDFDEGSSSREFEGARGNVTAVVKRRNASRDRIHEQYAELCDN